ncbi:MAG: hypothetical protein DWQ04_10865, partial [Chloroflexi bacterium]
RRGAPAAEAERRQEPVEGESERPVGQGPTSRPDVRRPVGGRWRCDGEALRPYVLTVTGDVGTVPPGRGSTTSAPTTIDGLIGAILAAARGGPLKRLLRISSSAPKFRALLVATVLVTGLLVTAPPAAAQDYTWTLSAMGGIGSAIRDGGGSETGFQLGFGLQFEPNANVWIKGGQLSVNWCF